MNSLQASSLSVSLQDDALALEMTSKEPSLTSSVSQTKLEGSTIQMSTEKPEMTLEVLEGDKSAAQLSSPSPMGPRVSSVTIIKASPDSKREFSVATMVEDRPDTSKGGGQEMEDGGRAKVTWTLGDEKGEMEEMAECRVTRVGQIGTEEKAALD